MLRALIGSLLILPQIAAAQIFTGGGIETGLKSAGSGLNGISKQPLRSIVIRIMINILNYLSLAAVIVIVVAGIWLILGFGEEGARDKAKRMIIYTLIGLAIVFFARTIVGFIQFILAS